MGVPGAICLVGFRVLAGKPGSQSAAGASAEGRGAQEGGHCAEAIFPAGAWGVPGGVANHDAKVADERAEVAAR